MKSQFEPYRLLSFNPADSGPGLLHDNVLPVSESGNLLRLGNRPLGSKGHLDCFSKKRTNIVSVPAPSRPLPPPPFPPASHTDSSFQRLSPQ